jgi:hypothetical protein
MDMQQTDGSQKRPTPLFHRFTAASGAWVTRLSDLLRPVWHKQILLVAFFERKVPFHLTKSITYCAWLSKAHRSIQKNRRLRPLELGRLCHFTRQNRFSFIDKISGCVNTSLSARRSTTSI